MDLSFKTKKTNSATALSPEETKDLKCLKPVNIDAQIVVDRNRWFLITALMGVIALVAVIWAMSASKRAEENFQLAYVKMDPNGMWEVDFYDESRGVEFFPSTIDYLIRVWVERRYSEIAYSIQTDYGHVKLFMAPGLQIDFVNEFGAPQKAAEIMACVGCPEKTVEVVNIDHYDSDRTTFGRNEGTLYRTNVFVKVKTVKKDGSPINTERKIVGVHWRLQSKEEIKANPKLLEYNPVGLKVMKYYMMDDPSDRRGDHA